jgi:hypothetical protein
MTKEKWGEILDKVSESFTVEDQGKEALTDVLNGSVEFIVFTSPMGKIRLELETTPRVESTKAAGGSKYGAGSFVEKVYSDTDTVNTFSAWKEVDGEWEAMSGFDI